MDADTAALVAEIRSEYPSCFACGSDNPQGLHMATADLIEGEAVASFAPDRHHGGAGDTLHGGLAATVLDEIMVWAAILTERVLTVTGTMALRYKRPVRVTDSIEARGRVDGRSENRLRCSASLVVAGEVRVTATGLYLVARAFD